MRPNIRLLASITVLVLGFSAAYFVATSGYEILGGILGAIFAITAVLITSRGNKSFPARTS